MQQENGGDDDDNNCIRILIGGEMAGVGLNDQQIAILINDNWYREVRTHAIPYILSTGQEFLFSRQTVYTAVMYLDRFLANRILPNGLYWTVRLLAVACLSLSAELNERRDNLVPLSDYPLGLNNINVNAIRRTKCLVLNEFHWDMNFVTPFAFINFFILRFCRVVSRIEITRMRTAEFIMSVVTEMRIMITYRPSVIAAAATLLAVNRNFTVQQLEIEINALPINGFLHIDNVYFCYYSLRELNYN